MKDLYGSPGRVSGLMLRIGQCVFAAASIGVMVSASGFSSSTAFCYLIASMGLLVLWSFGLACLDMHALRLKRNLQNHVLVSLFVVGDWVVLMITMVVAGPHLIVKHPVIEPLSSKPSKICLSLQVTAILSLAAACSSAGVVVLFARDTNLCVGPPYLPCIRFQIAIAFAFMSWFLLAISSHVMFWLLASV